jgi:hypothetical protein
MRIKTSGIRLARIVRRTVIFVALHGVYIATGYPNPALEILEAMVVECSWCRGAVLFAGCVNAGNARMQGRICVSETRDTARGRKA